jgi:hypothetical protein
MSPKHKFFRDLNLSRKENEALSRSLWPWESHPFYTQFFILAGVLDLGLIISFFLLTPNPPSLLLKVVFNVSVVGSILAMFGVLLYRYLVDRKRAWAERVHKQSDEEFIIALDLENDPIGRQVALAVRHALGRIHGIDPQWVFHTDTNQSIHRLMGILNYPPDRRDFFYELWVEIDKNLALQARELVASMDQFGVWKARNVRDLVSATINALEYAVEYRKSCEPAGY